MIKKIILAVLALAPLSALAQGFVPLAQIPGLTDANSLSVANATNLASFFNNLYKYAIGAAATLAVIEIIWGGLEISTKDSVSKNQNGKERIQNAIFGLVLVLSPALVFSLINPAILNLSLNLKPLDTRSAYPSLPGTTPVTLSDVETQLREGQGVRVLYAFTIDRNLYTTSPRDAGRTLDNEQARCTNASGGPGIVVPAITTGTGDAEAGSNMRYVCQTCPPNSTLRLLPAGRLPDLPRGTCDAGPQTTQPEPPAPGAEGRYDRPQPGMSCLEPRDTSGGAYYCTRDRASCNTALNSFGATNVKSGCSP